MNEFSANQSANEIDPFAVFGSDDDDEAEKEQEEEKVHVINNHVHSRGTNFVHPTEPVTTNPTTGTATTTINAILPIGEKLSKIPNLGQSTVPIGNDDDDEDRGFVPWPEQRNSQLTLYISPKIRLVQSLVQFGGSRGYIATQTISPGTLLLIEQPIVAWTELPHTSSSSTNHNKTENEQLLHILYHHILMNSSLSSLQKQEIINDLEFFHPTKCLVDECLQQESDTAIPSNKSSNGHEDQQLRKLTTDTIEQVYNMVQELHLHYGVDQSKEIGSHGASSTAEDMTLFQQIRNVLVQLNLTNRDATPIANHDIYRIILTLRYNALQSGLYYNSAMFNHSDVYNCVKFIPTTNTTIRPAHVTSCSKYSEIRTTRTVVPGEPLTISYIPHILSHASRRHYLWQQHRFDIGNNIPPDGSVLCQMEYIHTQFPVLSNMNDYTDTVTYNIETAVSELEGMYHDIEHLLRIQQLRQEIVNNDDVDLFQQAQELEQASLELCISAERELLQNPIHILLIPCRRLHVDICCMMQQHYENQLMLLSMVDRMKLLSRLVLSAHQLRQLQMMLYGPDHFDIARTDLDLAQAIEELLSRSPKQLLKLSLPVTNLPPTGSTMPLQTITQWSTLEHRLKKDFERIQALYPNNADDYITAKLTRTRDNRQDSEI